MLTGCSSTENEDAETTIDFDLTEMSSTMILAQVYDLLVSPTTYEETTFKIEGEYEFYVKPSTGENIYFIVINDATGCCPQGIEIRFPDTITPPDETCTVIIEGNIGLEEIEIYTYVHIDVLSLETI